MLLNVQDLTYIKKRSIWPLKRTRHFQLGPISFEVKRGETIAIIGENRAGKSLLAKLLVGAVPATGGQVLINETAYAPGQKRTKHSADLRRDVRMIFQYNSDALNPGLTIGDILDEPLRLNTSLPATARRAIVEQTLVKLGLLREHAYFYRHMLSDGQQQRVVLARAIILEPKVLVADEPFAALDPSIRSQTVNLLLQLQREMGLAFIFISHNLGIVRHIADKIIVLDNGQIVETGKTDTLFRWPQHEVTKKLLAAYKSLIPQQRLTE